MRKPIRILNYTSFFTLVHFAIIMLFFAMTSRMAFTSVIAEEMISSIMAGSSSAMLIPFVNNQAIAVQYIDMEHVVELLLANETGVQNSIRIPCERGQFCFVPSISEAPEVLIYDDFEHTLTWYEWKGEQLSLLRKWDGSYSYIAKAEGLMLISKENIEFVDSRRRTLLKVSRNLSNLYYDDVIWDNKGWILLSREASPTNLRTVRRISLDGTLLWTCEFPEIKEIDGFFSDGDGGVWLSYSSDYTGVMNIYHINRNGVQDKQILLDGEARVKYFHCGIINKQGEVTLYGSSVAHSKNVYQVFALTLNSSGSVLSLEVRDFESRKDYGIILRQSADGVVYVCSENYNNEPPLLVPFSSLMITENHVLLICEY